MKRGYFTIGIENTKTVQNIGTLWRSAKILGADYIFTINERYKHQSSDTMKAPRHIPLFHYENFYDFYSHLPYDCDLIGVELINSSISLTAYVHPERACYLLGAEDVGLSSEAIKSCKQIVQLPGAQSLNVAVAGSIVMYDRFAKQR